MAHNLAPLLKDPRVFFSREIERLLDKFIDAIIKEVDAYDKLAKIGRSGGHSSQLNRGNSFWRTDNLRAKWWLFRY